MKKVRRVTFRTEPEEWHRFESACANINEDASTIVRHLCKAATEYIEHNQLTEWYPPKLVPNTPATLNPAVYMGNATPIVHAREIIDPIRRAAEPRGPQPATPTSPTRPTEYPRIKKRRH